MIRPARPDDASAIAAIYDYYARTTTVSFALHAPDPEAYRQAILEGRYPFLVCEEEGVIAGFACAEAFRPHHAYRWDAELTLYLLPAFTGRGLGSRLMGALLRLLRRQGFLLAYSCVTADNAASLQLHRHMGFQLLGTFPDTGYKHGRWLSVVWLSFALGEHRADPPEPTAFRSIPMAEVAALIG